MVDIQTRAELWQALQKLREEEYQSRKSLMEAMEAHEKLLVLRFKAELAYELAMAGAQPA